MKDLKIKDMFHDLTPVRLANRLTAFVRALLPAMPPKYAAGNPAHGTSASTARRITPEATV